MAEEESEPKGPSAWLIFGSQCLTFLNSIRESYGIAGAAVFVYLVVMWAWGTTEQKHEFIQKVLLGHMFDGMETRGIILATMGLAILAVFLVIRSCRSIKNVKDQEIAVLNQRLRSLEERERMLGRIEIQPKLDLDRR
ncbi:MAG TPA: hypothetical protein VFF76_04500 [Holophagaceae bacterium]|jgi:hypothetical protein|nr:hypothetical protein [Holophagaceae bacterium]